LLIINTTEINGKEKELKQAGIQDVFSMTLKFWLLDKQFCLCGQDISNFPSLIGRKFLLALCIFMDAIV